MNTNEQHNVVQVGRNIMIGVAPGWIFAGHVVHVSDTVIILQPALYVEKVSKAWPFAARDRKIVTEGHPIPRLEVAVSAKLWAADASEGVVGKAQLDAVENVD